MAILRPRFNACAVNRSGNAHTGANRNRMPILDHRHKGSAVRYIRNPVFEPAAQQKCVALTDRDWCRAPHHVLGENISRSCRDDLDWPERRKEGAVTMIMNGQPPQFLASGFLAG